MAFRAKCLRLFLLSLVFPLFSAILAVGQSNCSINLGAVLTAGGNSPPWISPAGDFAFGFQRLQRSPSTNQDRFLLAIWYDNIPDQTVVWSLNDHPVEEGSRVQLTNEGQLTLYDSQGQQVWKADTGNERTACAAMLDSGNFVLLDAASIYLWESFRLPTDTILPGQRLYKDGRLIPRRSDADYTDGRFQLRMQLDGNLVLYPVFLPTRAVARRAYWASGTNRPDADSELVFAEAGLIYIEDRNKNIFNVTKQNLGSRQNFYYMAKIDYDGAFRHYNHPRGNSTADAGRNTLAWSIVQTTPEDMCSAVLADLGSGACGYNSYCVNSGGRPNCLCPQGYSPVDPLDMSQGCKPNFNLPSCQQNGWESSVDSVEFKELNNTDWPFTDYELQTGPDVDKERCKEFCLRDCYCAAAIYNENNCWKKRFPLSNGKQSASVNRIALIKVPRNNQTTLCPKSKDRSTVVLVVSVLLGSSVFFNFLLLIAISVAIFLIYHKKMLNLQPASTLYGIRRYTYKELEDATEGFKQQLGRGSFGTVYKGVIHSNPMRHIAIKKLDMAEKGGENEFTTEVNAIGQTHHKNLVNLLGYCDEGTNRLLVYEYMSNGSLASLLFSTSRPRWNQRLQIAFGIARGLTYLHEECSTQIIHCDIKPQNILLDEYLIPKISDFGLAKLLLSEQSRAARTHIRGTVGYFAPEWFRKASITSKVDVYSFGVMLLEIVCCMSSVKFAMGDQEEALTDWVYDCYSEEKLEMLVEDDEEAMNDMNGVARLVMVAIWCIQEDPSLRPSMRRVTQLLEGVAQLSDPPRPSAVGSTRIAASERQ
ncbi:G-type lectin S-receptor-like serine/threonine-protein kinase LECRK3 [Sesamum angolense]|uniref:Receptor-like serine/threonine-protein kinase n=1 Tax=Sesamum angolense TaxID=2727404 RepID=A0AAE2C708_9LAMI|nr:G-type lectin S-receptor-like serine/threonine-protein kinase LECRK3 [Sesamum angolense]